MIVRMCGVAVLAAIVVIGYLFNSFAYVDLTKTITEEIRKRCGTHGDEVAGVCADIDGDGGKDCFLISFVMTKKEHYMQLDGSISSSGKFKKIKPVKMGRIGIDSFSVENGTIVIRAKKFGADDPNCCPSVPVLLKYNVAGDAFVKAE